jgi:TonB family protein
VAVFTPPQLISGDPPGLPPPTVVGGGEVLVEATIDKSGNVTHPILLRNTPPYGQMVLDAISRWRFTPAHAPDAKGADEVVEAPVLIAAVYRAPAVFNNATLGTAPVDQSRASSETPYPVVMPAPGYPTQAQYGGGVVMLEASLDAAGIVRGLRTIRSNPAFDAVARDAVSQWKFRGASLRSLPVPSNAYIIAGFAQPVGLGQPVGGPSSTPPVGSPTPPVGGPSKIP